MTGVWYLVVNGYYRGTINTYSLPIFLHTNIIIINYYDILIFMTVVVRAVRLRVNSTHYLRP